MATIRKGLLHHLPIHVEFQRRCHKPKCPQVVPGVTYNRDTKDSMSSANFPTGCFRPCGHNHDVGAIRSIPPGGSRRVERAEESLDLRKCSLSQREPIWNTAAPITIITPSLASKADSMLGWKTWGSPGCPGCFHCAAIALPKSRTCSSIPTAAENGHLDQSYCVRICVCESMRVCLTACNYNCMHECMHVGMYAGMRVCQRAYMCACVPL